ncbi:hypothetical protein CC78DRAFT_543167 [Lojkania enalia]|uniref:Uncharacterized protein n=1 Tax=Lojkania enalia TaxID=147567 RepID=A0A9P4KFS9_9PLEO|nr:hypothetical protein CC78DRAFT_543167 [Didymosphaeria enalia]
MDALNECDDSDGERKKFLSSIINLQDKTGEDLFVTSRSNGEIAKRFKITLSLQICANKGDAGDYFGGQMSLLQSDIWDKGLRDTVRSEISNAADGIFLLAQLPMNSLPNQPTKGHVKEVLQRLAKEVDRLAETYEQAMERIQDPLANLRIVFWDGLFMPKDRSLPQSFKMPLLSDHVQKRLMKITFRTFQSYDLCAPD